MSTPSQLSRFHRMLENCTLLTTLGMKLVGLASGFNQLLLQEHHDPVALMLSGLLIAGGQVSEGLILKMLDRLLGEGPAAERKSRD